jgi:hypothetical protein
MVSGNPRPYSTYIKIRYTFKLNTRYKLQHYLPIYDLASQASFFLFDILRPKFSMRFSHFSQPCMQHVPPLHPLIWLIYFYNVQRRNTRMIC